MAVENELIYIVRLNAEGEEEVVKAHRVIDETGKAATKSEKQVGSLGNTMGSTGKKSKKFSKQNSAASNALLDLTRVAQDAPYGIRGVANNLEQAALSSGRAVTQFGGVKGALQGMVGSLTGVGGVVAGITAFNLILQGAESGLFSFGEEVKRFETRAEKIVEKFDELNSELVELKGLQDGGFMDLDAVTEELENVNLAEEDIKDTIIEIGNEHIPFQDEHFENFERYRTAVQRFLSGDQLERFKQAELALDRFGKRRKELEDERAAITFARDNIDQAQIMQQGKEREEQLEKIKELEESLSEGTGESLDIPTPFFGEDALVSDKMLEEYDKWRAKQVQEETKRAQKRIKAQEQAEDQLSQMRINNAVATSNRIEAINLQEQREIEQIRDQELWSEEQRQAAITEIHKKYARRRKDIVMQIERSVAQQRQQVTQMGLEAARSLYLGFAQDNKGIALGLLALEKGLQVARVVADTTRKAAQATATGYALLANPLTAPLAANAFAQAGAIKATGAAAAAAILAQGIGEGAQIMGTGGSAGGATGGRGSVGYRGFSMSSPASTAGQITSRPDRTRENEQAQSRETRDIRIIDGFDNIVARGQEEIDRKGGLNYLGGG